MREFLFLLIGCVFFSCREGVTSREHPIYKSIANDSALYYYELGGKQIMDEGNYGLAEISYRKVLKHDPEFLIGKSVLGRLTLDLEERLRIEKEVQSKKERIVGDERKILEVYHTLVQFTNAREQKLPETKTLLKEAFQMAQDNLKIIAHKYPDEIYMKAEYIEFLHSRYGPRNTLDSLRALTSDEQKANPFLLGYSASMEAEMDNFEEALRHANRLKKLIDDPSIPKPYVVFADIYFQMDSLTIAKTNVEKAVKLDSRNLDASRLKEKIQRKLQSQTN